MGWSLRETLVVVLVLCFQLRALVRAAVQLFLCRLLGLLDDLIHQRLTDVFPGARVDGGLLHIGDQRGDDRLPRLVAGLHGRDHVVVQRFKCHVLFRPFYLSEYSQPLRSGPIAPEV